MSSDDPSDDELEREARADIPAGIPNARHAPRLGTVSRAINPRQLLQAEAEGQSREMVGQLAGVASYTLEQHMRPGPPPATPRGLYSREAIAAGEPYVDRGVAHRPHSTLPRGMPRVVPPPPRAPVPPPVNEDARAWDAYAAAALESFLRAQPDATEGALAEWSASVADALLEERRRRFA